MRHVFAAVALLCLAAISVQGAVIPGFGAKVHVAEQPSLEGTWTSDANAGWTDRAGEPRWQFNLRSNGGADHWGFGIRPMELVGVPAAAMDGTANDVRFSWTREAGTFRFTGPLIAAVARADTCSNRRSHTSPRCKASVIA